MNRYDISDIRALVAEGRNIADWVREREGSAVNSATAVLYAYDAQAGTYVASLRNPENLKLKLVQASKLATILDGLAPSSLLDAGTGEATTLAPTLNAMQKPPQWALAFDISLSRLLHARAHLQESAQPNVDLFAAALERIPLPDASVDVVMTCHAMEPNHGREEIILRELLRVTSRHLVLIEPSWEFASHEMRYRMERHGYVRGLPETIEQLGYTIDRHERWELDVNPLNAAALIVVSRGGKASERPRLVSPISRKPLVRYGDSWFCPGDGHAFPIVGGVPSMLVDSAILCSQLDQFSPAAPWRTK